MNVFDFDKTLYPGDSMSEFMIYMALRRPSVALGLVKGIPAALRYKRGRTSKTEMKGKLLSSLSRVENIEGYVKRFWDKREGRIYRWYREMQREDDVVISASPEFFLSEICGRLGIKHLIGSRFDPKTGKFTGENCYGKEKPKRFAAEFSVEEIEDFYSDSYSDAPMARLAQRAYIIRGGKITPWDKEKM